ncbi:MAG: hypothetical protein ACYDCK_13190 [Thermoplasmatota archaeon]
MKIVIVFVAVCLLPIALPVATPAAPPAQSLADRILAAAASLHPDGVVPASERVTVSDGIGHSRAELLSDVLARVRNAAPPQAAVAYPFVANDAGLIVDNEPGATNPCFTSTVPASAINLDGGRGFVITAPMVNETQADSPCDGFPTWTGDFHARIDPPAYGEVCAAAWADLPLGGCILGDGIGAARSAVREGRAGAAAGGSGAFHQVDVYATRLGWEHIEDCYAPPCITVDLLYAYPATAAPREPGVISIA